MLETIVLAVSLVETCYEGSKCTQFQPEVLQLVEDYYMKQAQIDIEFVVHPPAERNRRSLYVYKDKDLKNLDEKYNNKEEPLTVMHTSFLGQASDMTAIGIAFKRRGLTFIAPLPHFSVQEKATLIKHEIGHLLGLSHTESDPNNLMNAYQEEDDLNLTDRQMFRMRFEAKKMLK